MRTEIFEGEIKIINLGDKITNVLIFVSIMLKNSPARIYNYKIFPGVMPPYSV